MITRDASTTEDILKRLATLSDPTRLRLLRILERSELGVSELCEVLQLPQSTTSRHLKVLTDERWLTHRRRGTTNLYRLLLDELEPAAREQWLLTRGQTEAWPTFEHDALRVAAVLERQAPGSREFFASAAGQWDATRRELYGSDFLAHAVAAVLPADWTVADLGCGTGALVGALARSVKRVIGVDNSKPMLAAARKRLQGVTNVDLREGELATPPIDEASCDAAVAVLVLTYVASPADVLDAAVEVLKPGGTLVVVDLLRHDREDFRRAMQQLSFGFECEALAGLLHDAGLADARCEPLPPEPDAKGPALLLAHGRRPA